MKSDFQILGVDERKGYCALVYKTEKYFLTTKGGNEFTVWGEDGEERESSYVAVPSKNYMSYSEYFHSQEFKEEFISGMLGEALRHIPIFSVRGYEEGYLQVVDEDCVIKNYKAVCYKNEKYHYFRTDDKTGDLVQHETFDTEASFWEYFESIPYVRNILAMHSEDEYRPKCVDGKYVEKSPEPRPEDSPFWKARMQQISDRIVKHYEPVLKKAEIKRPVIFLVTFPKWGAAPFEYEFACMECKKKIYLRIGSGRSDYLGGFRCPFCRRKYFATIDDKSKSPTYIYDTNDIFAAIDDESQLHTYIYDTNDIPGSYLEGDYGDHKPLLEGDFQVLRVDEEQGCCALAYKTEKYFLVPEEDYNFRVWKEDGKERFNWHSAVPSKDYMTYSEYFHSQEFKEEFISDMLANALMGIPIYSARGYDETYLRIFDEYRSIEQYKVVCYKHGMYHYLRTDGFGEVVEHEAFDNEASFWEYLESTPYMQGRLHGEYKTYHPKCVDGVYAYQPYRGHMRGNPSFWKERVLQMNDKTVKHNEPVLKKREIKRPVIKETDTIWLAVSEGDDTAYKYEFVCDSCEKKINLRTGAGRYGYLGYFRCPFCRRKYFASIDDNPDLHVYIYDINDMPASYLEGNHGPHKPLFELEMLEENLMESDFQILEVDEGKGCCALAYKTASYFLTPKGENEFTVWREDGEERPNPHIAVPSKDYMSYSEYFHSQEFKEEFITGMLGEALINIPIDAVQGYEEGYLQILDEYCIIKNRHAVCYKNGMYHYLETDDDMGDLVVHETFDNEASFWEYFESRPYVDTIIYMYEDEDYRPKCVNGKYVEEPPKLKSENSAFWKTKMQQISAGIVQHNEPVMKKAEIKKPVIFLAVPHGANYTCNPYKYEFACSECEKKIHLKTGAGRYGYLGYFRCPFCRKDYFAQIDDNPRLHVYIYNVNNMPAGYLDRRPEPLFELEMLEE